MDTILQQRAKWIRQEAGRLGFSFVGFAKAEALDEPARRLEAWLRQGAHGKMAWMERYFDLRIDPTKLVPGARTVICLAYNYHNPDVQDDPSAPRISQYAYGEDYHFIVKRKLKELLFGMQSQFGRIEGRCFVDSAPIMEREWAHLAGIGWNGKHTLTIHPRHGSYFFLAEIICDIAVATDHPIRDHCGTCRRCIEACPTEAIHQEGYWLDASKCISYLTIELREEIPDTFRDRIDNWVFGCDICQEVCPWNRFSKRHTEAAFEPQRELLSMKARDWEELTEDVFGKVFKRSAVKRIKLEGLRRNIRFIKPGTTDG
jgi:epoxyqueuosine reductase